MRADPDRVLLSATLAFAGAAVLDSVVAIRDQGRMHLAPVAGRPVRPFRLRGQGPLQGPPITPQP